MRKLSKKLYYFHRTKLNNFSFQKIYYKNLKLTFLIKDGLIYVSVCGETSKSHYIKLFLTHMCVAFINFNGILVETLKNLTANENIEELDYSRNEFLQLKIYELNFVKHITNHFDRVFKFLVNKDEMYLSYIKFKNMCVLDLSSGEIIFDILALRNSKKNKKIYKNEKLWQEILHHSKSLMDNYKSDFGNTYDNKDGFFRFVKFECTSTYPRLTFIIKFLPILKGISIIHMYSQKKLSRMSDNNDQHITNKGYKEIDLLYGAEVKNNNNIEFRYTEPRKLQEIEKFIIEFFISIRSNSDIYHDINHELKYFDYTIITSINEILVSHREIKYITEDIKVIELTGAVERGNSSTYNFLLIKKENILQELFCNADKNDLSTFSNINKSKLSQYASDNEERVIEKYVEHEDGWAMRTKGNNFGLDLNKNEKNEKNEKNPKKGKKNSLNSNINNTLNISRNEIQNHHTSRGGN